MYERWGVGSLTIEDDSAKVGKVAESERVVLPFIRDGIGPTFVMRNHGGFLWRMKRLMSAWCALERTGYPFWFLEKMLPLNVKIRTGSEYHLDWIGTGGSSLGRASAVIDQYGPHQLVECEREWYTPIESLEENLQIDLIVFHASHVPNRSSLRD